MRTGIDKRYISFQFKDKIHTKNGTEFQSFFAEVMEKLFPGFRKIRPYGNKGDGGNDGYIRDKGGYYQIYAPNSPEEKDSYAAKKFKDDFNALKEKWDGISKIKSYNFVFNDKYKGSSIVLEDAKTDLENENPDIDFNIICAKDFENIFEELDSDQLVFLGFDVDSRNVLKIMREYIQELKIKLDKDNIPDVSNMLETAKPLISEHGDEDLELELELIDAEILRKMEKVDDAIKKYSDIYKRHPRDSRAPLYLAQIYLSDKNFEENQRLLNEAKEIDASFWLYDYQILLRHYVLRNQINLSNIDENKFPNNQRNKSDYYRIYSILLKQADDIQKSDEFIEKAIHLNPSKFNNYIVKLSFIEQKMMALKEDEPKKKEIVQQLLTEIQSVHDKFAVRGYITPRNRISLNIKKSRAYFLQGNYIAFEQNLEETFDLILECYFDENIEYDLIDLLYSLILSDEDFAKLQKYLENTKRQISDKLAKGILIQFFCKDILVTEGKKFCTKHQKDKFIKFIEYIEAKEYDKLKPFFNNDSYFATLIYSYAEAVPELRTKILEIRSSDSDIQKEELLFLNKDNPDKAFSILKDIDLSKLNHHNCQLALDIAKKNKAWDTVISILERLLEYEKDSKNILHINLQLFMSNMKLERFPQAISIGKQVLETPSEIILLSEEEKEDFIIKIAFAFSRRGQNADAEALIEKYKSYIKEFEHKIFAAEIYIKNNNPKAALTSIVEGIKYLKRPSPEEYGNLFLIFVEIENMMDFTLISNEKVEQNSFIKFKDEDKWFYIGTEEELDAIKIMPASHTEYLNKRLDEKIVSSSKYRSKQTERKIEKIFSIEKYIFWQSWHNAHKLSLEGAWDKMEVIEVPETEEGIDLKFLRAKREDLDDYDKETQEFFNMYCQPNNIIPFAYLVLKEGGLPAALGRLKKEQRGFINASSGTRQDKYEQNHIANQVIDGQSFYLDGTSAWVLSETGLLGKVYPYLPNLKVPQSVITFLLDLKEKYSYMPRQFDHMCYDQGKIVMSDINQAQRRYIKNNFEQSIKILESKLENIVAISSANKSRVSSEQKIFPSLVDACVLAQRDNVPVLTEDFLYLHMNERETKKAKPYHFSSLALVKALHERNHLTFEDYLNFFSYLSSYRFKFLSITTDDLEKAVFGDGDLMAVKVENLRLFNFPLTLSEDYGVDHKAAMQLVLSFIVRQLVNDAVIPEIIKRIFAEIVDTFPTNKDRKIFGRTLIKASVQYINQDYDLVLLSTRIQEKIDALSQYIEIYSPNEIIQPFS